jgi:tetrahydromethanopterin S-methyltransferase subunit G
MSEEEKLEEVVSHLNRLLAKQRRIEERMKKIEEAVENKGTEE